MKQSILHVKNKLMHPSYLATNVFHERQCNVIYNLVVVHPQWFLHSAIIQNNISINYQYVPYIDK